MRRLCIIPARGGSKRIPLKNIKSFLGKPIIAYSIQAAIESNLFDKIIVSTDSEQIKEIALKFGATVPFLRSDKNADDFATTFDVIEEVVLEFKKKNTIFDEICCIYPTAPFVNSRLLIDAQKLLESKKFDSVFPVLPFSFPIQRAVKKDSKTSKMTMFQPENLNARSQDLEKAYHDAGQFYFFKSEEIMLKKKLWTNNTGIIEIDEMQGQDIDTLMDWKLAEIKYQLLYEKEINI